MKPHYFIVLFLVLIFGYFFLFNEDSDDTTSINAAKQVAQNTDKSSTKNNVKIEYETTNSFAPRSFANDNKPKVETQMESDTRLLEEYKEKHTNSYAVVGGIANTQDYMISVISSQKIETRKDGPPTIPAVINGAIDGQNFKLSIPTNITNQDLKIRVVNKGTHEDKDITNISITDLKPGSVSIMTLFFNDLGNAHIIKGESASTNDMPPMPPMPSFK